jgi:hypothetical protein
MAGTPGTAGTARAYGLIAADGTVSRSHDITAVTHGSPGADFIYCIALDASIDPATTGAVITLDYSHDATQPGPNADQAFAEWNAGGSHCPSGTLEVETGKRTVVTQPTAAAGVPSPVVTSVDNKLSPEPFFIAIP